jgi:hypothetical protein
MSMTTAAILEALPALPPSNAARDLAREQRAAQRRATYSGSIVRLGQEKPALYDGKSPLERLALQTALIERLARLGKEVPTRVPRDEWPGEVFNIDERNAKLR